MISQQTFIIPPEVQAGLAVGDLIQYGGIVRNKAGQIVRHLKAIDLPVDSEKTAAAALQSLKNPNVAVAAFAVAAAGACAVAFARRRKEALPECVAEYNASLSAYLKAVKEGRLDADVIDKLLSTLDAVEGYADSGTSIALDFSTDHAALLVKLVIDSTKQIAEDNSLDVEGLQGQTACDNVVDFRRYLETQRSLFKEAG